MMPKLPKDVKKFAEMFGSSTDLKPTRSSKPLREIDIEILEDGERNIALRCTACGAKFDPLNDGSLDVVERHLKTAHRGKQRLLIWAGEV